MKKKIFCFLLSVTLIISSFPTSYFAFAASDSSSVNIAMLESLLDERNWVINTLVYDNYTNNPYTTYDSYANSNSLMSTTLSAYENTDDPNYIAAYSALIDIMEKVYNGDDYISSALDSFVSGFLDFFGSEETAQSYADDAVASVGELQYEQIMYEILSANYTSSSGESINNLDSQLMNVRRLQESSENLEEFCTFLKLLAQDSSGDSVYNATLTSYTDDFLLPYIDSIDDFLSNFETIQNSPNKDAIIAMLTAYSLIDIYDRFETTETSLGNTITTYAPNYLISSETTSVIKAAGKTVSLASSAIDSYTFIETMHIQKDSVANPLRDMATITSDSDMETVLDYVADLVEEESDASISNYEVIVSAVRNSKTVSSLTMPLVSTGVKSLTEKVFYTATANMISSSISKATSMVGVGSWCIDASVGFGETCKKMYELKYLDRLIDTAVDVYEQRLSIYYISGTDEAAQDVLDTLALIQKMRLRGETIAYKMTINQLDSLVGKWFSGDTDASYQTELYQSHVDALVGASVVSMPSAEITISSGTTVTVLESASGDLYGKVLGSENYILGEFIYNTLGGITVESGGTLMIGSTSGSHSLPTIKNTGGQVNYYDDSIQMTEYQQTSGELLLNSGTSPYIETLVLSGGTIYDNTASIQCQDFYSSGSFDLENTSIMASGDTTISGNLTNGSVSLIGNKEQTLSGTGTVETLILDNSSTSGIVATGSVNVSGTISNPDSNLQDGTNIILKGDMDGSIFNGGITLDGVNLTDTKQINGDVQIKNTVTAETLICKEDITAISGGTLSSDTLQLSGTTGQNINCAITTQNFSNYNTAYDGVTLSNTLNVSGQLRSPQNTLETNDKLYLQTGASFPDESFYGDVVVAGSVTQFPTYFYGNMTMNHNVSVADTMTIQGRVTIPSDITCTVSAPLTIGGMLHLQDSTSTITIEENTSLTTNGDCYNSGTINGLGKIIVLGDVVASSTGTTSFNQLYLAGSNIQTLDGTINVVDLVNENSSSSGVTISDTLNVSNSIKSLTTALNAGTYLHLLEGATFVGDVFYGDVVVEGSVEKLPMQFNGNLYIESDIVNTRQLTISKNMTITGATYDGAEDLTIKGTLSLSNSTAKLQMASDTTLTTAGIASNTGTIDLAENATWIATGDVSNSSSITGDGTFVLYGDMYTGSNLNIDTLQLIATIPKTITGSSFTVDNLILQGGSLLTLASTVNCTTYKNPDSTPVADASKILIGSGDNIEDTDYGNSMYITGDWTVESGATVSVSGSLSVSGTLTVAEGATLLVSGGLSQTGGTSSNIIVAENASLSIGKYASTTAGTITIDGTAQFLGDWDSNSGTISGLGTLEVLGDLDCSSGKVSGLHTLSFVSKAPQYVWGTMTCNNLIFDNPSPEGIYMSKTLYYTDTFTQNQTIFHGTVEQQ